MFELISYSIIYSRHLYHLYRIFKINSEINIRKFRRLERWRDGSLQRSDYPRARCMGYDVPLICARVSSYGRSAQAMKSIRL